MLSFLFTKMPREEKQVLHEKTGKKKQKKDRKAYLPGKEFSLFAKGVELFGWNHLKEKAARREGGWFA